MTSITGAPSPPSALDKVERVLVVVDRVLGGLVIAFGFLLLAGWWTGLDSDRHGMLYVWLAAQAIGPVGSLLLLASRAMKARWRTRWLWQLVPFLYPFVFFAALDLFL